MYYTKEEMDKWKQALTDCEGENLWLTAVIVTGEISRVSLEKGYDHALIVEAASVFNDRYYDLFGKPCTTSNPFDALIGESLKANQSPGTSGATGDPMDHLFHFLPTD